MSNASRCRATAARYAKLAEAATEEGARRVYRNLEQLWLAMAERAESFDRASDGEAKEQIYAMIDAVEHLRQKVA
jgi:hypothetical protein